MRIQMLVQNILDFFIYLMMFIILSQYYEQMIRHYSISTLNMQYQRKENPAYYIYPIGSCKKIFGTRIFLDFQIFKCFRFNLQNAQEFIYVLLVCTSQYLGTQKSYPQTNYQRSYPFILCVLSKREYHFCSLLDNLYLTSC